MSVRARAPCRADAERAAALLVSEGVSKVMLFGSVARGEATGDSDIDLVAIYDDLDYATRSARRQELSSLARAAVGHRVDVLVTDRPEWKVRTEDVVTSLESQVAGYGTVLFDNGIGQVDWDKEMVLPTNGYEETIRRLRDVSSALASLERSLRPGNAEQRARRSGNDDLALYWLVVRFEALCGHVQHTVESAIKALVHAAERQRPIRGHNIADLSSKLVEPYRREINARVALVGAAELTRWQQESRYTPEELRDPTTTEYAREMVEVACKVASYLVAQLDESIHEAGLVQQAVTEVELQLRSYDLETGTPIP